MRVGLAIGITAAQRPAWTPVQLGSKLKAWWDPSYGITMGSGLVSAWADRVGGTTLVQATGTSKPAWSATALNGAYPGLTFDGIDDFMNLTTIPAAIPTGTDASHLFALFDQLRAGTAAGANYLFAYGSTAAGGARNLIRINSANVNRLQVDHGGSALSDTSVDLSGIHLAQGRFDGSGSGSTKGWIDGAATNPAEVVEARTTGTARIRLGASLASTAASFASMVCGDVLVTADLTSDEAAKLQGWALWRIGKQANLPSGHTYKSARP